MPSVTKVNVVPPDMGSGSRGEWVSTNTGPWYGIADHSSHAVLLRCVRVGERIALTRRT